jgi:hypothetical protein
MRELLHVEPPTDAQLGYLATLREQWELPQLVVGSKSDASACISAIRENGSIEPWLWDEGVRTWSESVPF